MLLYAFDLLGTAVFAITGVLVGCRRNMDLFGVFVLAFVTAVGGGTIRDLLLGSDDIFWMTDQNYLLFVLGSVPAGLALRHYLQRYEQMLLIIDAIGLATFTVVGVQKTLVLSGVPLTAIIMGVLTGAGGGVIRDLLSGVTPLVLRKHIYAAASIAGGIVYTAGYWLLVPENGLALAAGITVFGLRLLAIHYDLSLPRWSI